MEDAQEHDAHEASLQQKADGSCRHEDLTAQSINLFQTGMAGTSVIRQQEVMAEAVENTQFILNGLEDSQGPRGGAEKCHCRDLLALPPFPYRWREEMQRVNKPLWSKRGCRLNLCLGGVELKQSPGSTEEEPDG